MIKDTVQNYLEDEPKFRERYNKDKGIVNLLMKKHHPLRQCIEQGLISKQTLIGMVQDYASMDRAWRQILEHNEHLQGKDYHDKNRLEEKAMEGLGYNIRKDMDAVEVDPQKALL